MTNLKTINGFLWRFFERCGAQGVTFIVSLILARLLDPNVYGIVALVTVFTTVLNVFVDSGMGNALIQKKDADDLDFSSVFYFNFAVCIILYILMFFSAPLIAGYYKMQELVSIIRVISLTLIISGVKNVQQAYVSRYLLFKRFFFATLSGTVAAAVVGILMAYFGFGVWALVAQNLLNMTIDTIILWVTVKWRPKKMFSWSRLKGLFSYGWKLLASGLIDTVYNNIRQLIIGKLYSSEDLAFYNRGDHFPNIIMTIVNTSIDSVLFPTMSAKQDDRNRVKKMTRRSIGVSSYIIMPLMTGMAVCAKPIVQLILTEKWLPCVPFLQIFCISYAFFPIHTANLNAIKAMGRSDLFLRLEIIKKIFGIGALAVSMWFGVKAMAYSTILVCLFSQIINAFPNKKLLEYGYLEQIKDILPNILLSGAMGAMVYCLGFIPLPDLLTVVLQTFFGIAVYIGASALLHLDNFKYLKNVFLSFIHSKKDVSNK